MMDKIWVRAARSARRWASDTLSSGMAVPCHRWNPAVVRAMSCSVSSSWRCSVVW
jgi:hypothetical protein